jgi:hypothetical protein
MSFNFSVKKMGGENAAQLHLSSENIAHDAL